MTPIQMMRHTARAALSKNSRRILPSSSLSSVRHPSSRNDASHHQKRPLATTATRPRFAQPNKFVTGVSTDQIAESQAMKDWYAANFPDHENEPDTTIVGEELDEEVEEDEEEVNPSIIKLPDHLVKRNIRPLVGYLREKGHEEGSRNCHKMRNPGVNDPNFPLIPGIIHGSDPTNSILSVDASSKIMVKTAWFDIQRELDRYHHGINGSFENRVYAMTVFPSNEAHLDHHRTRNPRDRTTYKVDDQKMEIVAVPAPPLPDPPPRAPVPGMENILVVASDLQMHPVSNTTFCLNFKRYHPNKPINIPIKLVNEEESPALKRGGFLLKVNRFIECLVEPNVPIPEWIELECTGLQQKDVVRRGKLSMPEGVTIHPRVAKDYLVGTVFGSRGSVEEGDEAEEGEEEKKG